MKVRFHGAAGTVTGSMHELTDEALGIHGLVDCGSFQGCDANGQREDRRYEPANLKSVLLRAHASEHSQER